MVNTFKPIRNLRTRVREALINGDIIKLDAGASDYMFIIPREQMENAEVLHTQVANIRDSKIPGAVKIPRVNISPILEYIEDEYGYTVLHKDCYSGACQYHTTIYYLAGE